MDAALFHRNPSLFCLGSLRTSVLNPAAWTVCGVCKFGKFANLQICLSVETTEVRLWRIFQRRVWWCVLYSSYLSQRVQIRAREFICQRWPMSKSANIKRPPWKPTFLFGKQRWCNGSLRSSVTAGVRWWAASRRHPVLPPIISRARRYYNTHRHGEKLKPNETQYYPLTRTQNRRREGVGGLPSAL